MKYYTDTNFVVKTKNILPKISCSDAKLTDYIKSGELIRGPCLQAVKDPEYRYLFFIPVEWLDSIGYTEEELKNWLEIICFKDVWNFSYRYYGKRTLDCFNSCTGTNSYSNYPSILLDYKPSLYGIKVPEFYVVGYVAKSLLVEAYLQLIALRYIYNIYYSDIPRSIFDILKDTPSSKWEAFILAHLKRKYYSFYSIVSQKNESYEENENCDNKPLNPFIPITQETINELNTSMSEESMIDAFSSLEIDQEEETFDIIYIRKQFKNKKYIDIYNYTKEFVNKK